MQRSHIFRYNRRHQKDLRLIDVFFRGARLDNLFADKRCGLSVFHALFASMLHIAVRLDEQTDPIANGYNEITVKSTRARFRLTLKYCLNVIFLCLLDALLKSPSHFTTPPLTIAAIACPILVIYLCTVRDLDFLTYRRLSIIVAYASTTLAVTLNEFDLFMAPSRNIMGIILLFCIFILLPLRDEQCFMISIIYIASLIGTRLFRLSIIKGLDIDLSAAAHPSDSQLLNQNPAQTGPTHSEFFGVHLHQLSVWLPVFVIALHLRFWSTLRCKLAFYKLGQSVEARRNADEALQAQIHWIDAIVPQVVRDEYHQMRRAHAGDKQHWWLFNKSYENVSILFADIVGFTRMSSLTSPGQVVAMLNNLFNRFDDLCELTQCEKLGTLGDCYYCVAGCPTPHPDHAIRCAEMGLGMCRIIKVFNCDFGQSVNMRIGIHTGRVNAAIIGAERFRFDVYSYDVIIASALESSGKPGRVHVSQHIFDRLGQLYNFSPGEPLEVKEERISGIAGMELATRLINTYFIDPRSTQWRVKHERFGQATELHGLTHHADAERSEVASVGKSSKAYRRSSQRRSGKARDSRTTLGTFSMPTDTDRSPGGSPTNLNSFDNLDMHEWSMQLMHDIKCDREEQFKLFNSLPITSGLMRFQDHGIEKQYNTGTLDFQTPANLDSHKVSPLSYLMICFILHLITLVCLKSLIIVKEPIPIYAIVVLTMELLINLIAAVSLIFVSTYHEHNLQSPTLIHIYRLANYPLTREVMTAIITFSHSVTYVLYESISEPRSPDSSQTTMATIGLVTILVNCVPIESSSWMRGLCAVCSSLLLVYMVQCSNPLRPVNGNVILPIGSNHPQYQCALWDQTIGNDTGVLSLPWGKFCTTYAAELGICLMLVCLLSRENERICRLCFYVSREADVASHESEKMVDEAKELLHNIIPPYVIERLSVGPARSVPGVAGGLPSSGRFNYAVAVPEAGVAFATISNFFASYYREDYKGGEVALKLLNRIVCMFDDLASRPEYKDVEKIKTINDCYMVASGLNTTETARNASPIDHLKALMDFCLALIERLDDFNDQYIIGTDRFEVKVGFNSGPIIAGIIGTTKPMYDIWGNTVNVSSRMYSTGLPDRIQTPHHVARRLDGWYEFTYRGTVPVKGKGDMETYFVRRLEIEG